MILHRLICAVLVAAQLVSCAPGQGQFPLPSGLKMPQLPTLPGLNIPGLAGLGAPSLQQLPGQAQQLAMQAIYTQVGRVLGDELPVKLDARTAFAKVAPPQNFNPAPIPCTPENMDTPLAPGDYTCQVRLYCMRDSAHRPGFGVPYEFGPLQGKQASAIGTLFARGTVANVPPTTLQTISWEIQASIPLDEMPAQHQQVVHQLIPEYERGLQGDFLQQVESTYRQYASVAGLPSFDALLARMGEAGRTIQQVRRSREIIRQNALNYERLDQELYDRSEGGPRTFTPAMPQTSPWSQIRPGVLGQLIIGQGNLGLNTFNFRVLPSAVRMGSADSYDPAVVKLSPLSETGNAGLYRIAYLTPAAPVTIGRIFLGGGAAAEVGGAAVVLGTGGYLLVGIGLGKAVQTLVMMMNNGGSGSESQTAQAPGQPTEADGYRPPKRWDGKKVKNPNGPGYGWPDGDGDVWVPTGPNGHGGPHWDVETPGGGYKNVYPGGKIR